MEEQIVNRVAKSGLITFEMESLYIDGERVELDIAQWLVEGVVLMEKRFRESVKNYDFSQHKDQLVALHCSADAIIPAWAWMLVTDALLPHVKFTAMGSLHDLEVALFRKIITELDLSPYEDQRVILAGCSDRPVPHEAYGMMTVALRPIVKSLFYGEACSSVPIYKRK